MKVKKKSFWFFAFVLICEFTIAQNFTVSYHLIYRPDATRVNYLLNKNYKLDIYLGNSVFRTDGRRTSDSLVVSGGYGLGYQMNLSDELYFTKDLNKERFRKHLVIPVSRDAFFVNIKEPLQWVILPRRKR